MAWTQLAFTHGEVEWAGRVLIADLASKEDRALAEAITNNWRSAHAFPLNTIQVNLRRIARSFDPDAIVAQRQKRLPSIVAKLERLTWLTLLEMQDLGGCRAVVEDSETARALANYYRQSSAMRHLLVQEDHYLDRPKRTGYRSIHLIYAYVSDRNHTYNGLKIEMQIRSRLQHAWATAVETVDAFTAQALKSNAGEKAWARFFVLMSAVIALREGEPSVPGVPVDQRELLDELGVLAKKLRVVERLRGYQTALRIAHDPEMGYKRDDKYVVLDLNTSEGYISWNFYNNAAAASVAYEAIERVAQETQRDAVLVRTDSLAALQRAYPNYFADTTGFVAAVEDAIAR